MMGNDIRRNDAAVLLFSYYSLSHVTYLISKNKRKKMDSVVSSLIFIKHLLSDGDGKFNCL